MRGQRRPSKPSSFSPPEKRTLDRSVQGGKLSPGSPLKLPRRKKDERGPFLVLVGVALFFTIAILLVLVPGENPERSPKPPAAPNPGQIEVPPRPPRNLPAGEVGVWAKGVVYIETGKVSVGWNDRTFTPQHAGSGFIISNSGDLLTNYHVIEGASMIVVTFHDGTWKGAEVVKSDPELDIALLKTELPPDVAHLNLSNDPNIQIGRRILVMGFPLGNTLGTEMTLTDGLISSIRHNRNRMVDWYQISAPVNPGNSGGPLLDETTGEVLGVVTAKIGKAEMIAFARPAYLIHNFLSQQ